MCISLQHQNKTNNIIYKNMKRTDFIETLSQEEMQTVKGGIWVYDKTTDTWKWIEKYSLDPDEEE